MEEKEVGEEEEDPEEEKRERGEGRSWIGGLFGQVSIMHLFRNKFSYRFSPS